MKEQNEKQAIEEMADILEQAKIDAHATIGSMNYGFGMWYAKACYNAGYRKQRVGEWLSVEGDVIFKCSLCDAEISTSWDYEEENMFRYCPCCGAHMKGGAE